MLRTQDISLECAEIVTIIEACLKTYEEALKAGDGPLTAFFEELHSAGYRLRLRDTKSSADPILSIVYTLEGAIAAARNADEGDPIYSFLFVFIESDINLVAVDND